jgi:hypothetical protein
VGGPIRFTASIGRIGIGCDVGIGLRQQPICFGLYLLQVGGAEQGQILAKRVGSGTNAVDIVGAECVAQSLDTSTGGNQGWRRDR